MASKIYNKKTNKLALDSGSDSSGAYVAFENGMRFYALTVAVTPNTTTTSAPVGSFAVTSNATGRGRIFFSDGAKWQNMPNS